MHNDNDSPSVGPRLHEHLLIIALSAIIVFLIIAGVRLTYLHWPDNGVAMTPAENGDFLGGHVSSIASTTGTLLFFIALMLQRQELRDARSVFTEHKNIAKKELEVLEKQSAESSQLNAVEALSTLAKFRHELRMSMAANIADANNPAWQDISEVLEAQYAATDPAIKSYLAYVPTKELRLSMEELTRYGIPIAPTDS